MLHPAIFFAILFAVFWCACVSAASEKTDHKAGAFQITHFSKLSGEAVVVKNDIANKPGSYLYLHIKSGLNPNATYKDYSIEFTNGRNCKHSQGSVVNRDTPAFKINKNGDTDAWCIDKTLDITNISMIQVRYQGEAIACSTLDADPNFNIKRPSQIDACIRAWIGFLCSNNKHCITYTKQPMNEGVALNCGECHMLC